MRHIIFFLAFLFVVCSCATEHYISKTTNKNISIEESVALPNAELLKLLEPYKKKLEADMSRVVAISDVEMVKNQPESKLSNFMADMLLESGTAYCKKHNMNPPDIAFVNYGGIRAILPKGEIKVQNIFELMPFENTMVFLKISGEKVKEMAAAIAHKGGDGIAGMKLGIKDHSAGSILIGGEKPESEKSYWIVTNDYVAGGGDNMKMFLNPEKMVASELTIRDIIIKYMEEKTKEGEHISAKEDGRIFYE